MRIYFDTEFTGLHNGTTLISIGCVAETGENFYAELTDFDLAQVNNWIVENVLIHLKFKGMKENSIMSAGTTDWCVGTQKYVGTQLRRWLAKWDKVEMWSDVLAYDWMLFNQLIANYNKGYPELPSNIYYIPFDISTYFKIKGIDPDCKRTEFAQVANSDQHNALDDAFVIKACYDRLAKM